MPSSQPINQLLKYKICIRTAIRAENYTEKVAMKLMKEHFPEVPFRDCSPTNEYSDELFRKTYIQYFKDQIKELTST